jgi:hypothetical protein
VAVVAVSLSIPATAAPARIGSMAITPVAANAPLGPGEQSVLVKFYDAKAITADEQNCLDLREYRVIDVEYVIDQTLIASTPNTITAILEHTNGAGADRDLTVNTAGQTVVSANVADADDLNRFDLYGVYTCVDLDVANTQPVTVTVYALVRK